MGFKIMYFNTDNNFFHGIMFHHFHDRDIHNKSQGSIGKDELFKIIKFIGRNNILNADLFFEKFKNNKLKANEVCLTFDDALKCQIDVALPILEDLKIKSFFFVYSSVFEDKPDNLECYRYFRTNYYQSIDDFYTEFYRFLDMDCQSFFQTYSEKIKQIKIKYSFYSIEDIKFRLVRDILISKKDYEKTMFLMFKEKKFNYKDLLKKLFFQNNDLINLNKLGHLIGLHGHYHNTKLENLSYEEQKKEYENNILSVSNILGKDQNEIKFMAHPCGSYNLDTLDILKKLGIELGFKNLMTVETEKGMKKINNSPLEIARQNHSDLLKYIY